MPIKRKIKRAILKKAIKTKTGRKIIYKHVKKKVVKSAKKNAKIIGYGSVGGAVTGYTLAPKGKRKEGAIVGGIAGAGSKSALVSGASVGAYYRLKGKKKRKKRK